MISIFKKQVMGITGRLRRRDFSGNTGIAMKNSIFQFSTNIFAKLGSLVFTAIIARMLLPELFGLYTLALSTILIFAAFSDLGIGRALIKFISSNDKNPKKQGDYILYLRNLKIKLTILISLILIASAYFIARYYYQKPIFYALLAGALYILSMSFLGFIFGLFQSRNNFRHPFYKEIFFQIIRLILVPLTIFLLIGSTKEIVIGAIILSLAVCYFLSIFFLYPKIKKYKNSNLSDKEKRDVRWFIFPLAFTALSLTFFGYIDIIMLGRFVESEYLAFYQAAIALISAVTTLIPFSTAFFPLFTRLKKEKLKLALDKSLILTAMLSSIALIFTLVLAPYAIRIIYGPEYLSAILLLRIFSVLLFITPFIAIFSNYYVSQSRNNILAKMLVFVALINIILNFVLIKYFLQISMFHATIGAAIATISSKLIFLVLLVKNK